MTFPSEKTELHRPVSSIKKAREQFTEPVLVIRPSALKQMNEQHTSNNKEPSPPRNQCRNMTFFLKKQKAMP